MCKRPGEQLVEGLQDLQLGRQRTRANDQAYSSGSDSDIESEPSEERIYHASKAICTS